MTLCGPLYDDGRVPHDVTSGRRDAVGITGAVGELIAAADLMRRGFYIFRAESPNAPCDLIAMTPDGSRVLRVECRTGRIYLPTGNASVPIGPKDNGRFDLLAVVIGNQIGYLGPHAPESFPHPITDEVRRRVDACIAGTLLPTRTGSSAVTAVQGCA